MKKLFVVVSTLLLAGSLAFAQNTGGDKKPKTDNPQESNKQGTVASPASTTPGTTSGKKGHKGGKKGHKGGKKSKKGSSTSTTPPPK